MACENRSAGVHAAEISQSDHHFGRRVYELNCAVCHGVQGDGNGPAAGMLVTRPRDFRSGIFKFRSTPSGSLPSDQDLFRTITDGVRWTGMIARPDLNDFELRAVVEYIKTFSPRFATSKPLAPVNITSPPQATAGLLLQGKNLFRDADCGTCHGDGGRAEHVLDRHPAGRRRLHRRGRVQRRRGVLPDEGVDRRRPHGSARPRAADLVRPG